MINRDFVTALTTHFATESSDLVEKDLILQQLLWELEAEKTFHRDYAFKGGTCLIKCYLGYYRFSEDLDFTYLKQDAFAGKSSNEIKRIVSPLIDHLVTLCEGIANWLDKEFKAEKSNSRYVSYGGNERMLTMKLWFKSGILDRESFVKLQINFAEILFFPIHIKEISYHSDFFDDRIRALFPRDCQTFSRVISIKVYDLREIAIEKMRAILTRRGTKIRDYIDLFFLSSHIEGGLEPLMPVAEKKIAFVTNLFLKYRNNMKSKADLLPSEILSAWEKERRMVLVDIYEKEFENFVPALSKSLKNLIVG